MSVIKPQFYCEIYYNSGASKYVATDCSYFKITKVVTASVGSFEIKLPHGSFTDFSKYKDCSVFNLVKIWVGTSSIGSEPMFVGKIDTVKTEIDSKLGYVTSITGRDLGEALFRYNITKDYFGYYRVNFTGSYGCDTTGRDVRTLTPYYNFVGGTDTGSNSVVNIGTILSGSLFKIKPYSIINASFGSAKPSNIQYTGSVTNMTFLYTGSLFNLNMRIYNSGSFSHSGRLWARLYEVSTTGSMTGPGFLSGWTASNTITFPAIEGYPEDATVYFNLTEKVATTPRFLHLEMLWEVTG